MQWPDTALSAIKEIKNNNPDQIKIKLLSRLPFDGSIIIFHNLFQYRNGML